MDILPCPRPILPHRCRLTRTRVDLLLFQLGIGHMGGSSRRGFETSTKKMHSYDLFVLLKLSRHGLCSGDLGDHLGWYAACGSRP